MARQDPNLTLPPHIIDRMKQMYSGPVKGPGNICPPDLVEELLRLYRLDPDWVQIRVSGHREGGYEARVRQRTGISQGMATAFDHVGMFVMSRWIGEGPKIFRPTTEQCEVFEQVDLNLAPRDFTSPFPTLLVALPEKYLPYRACIVLVHEAMLAFTLPSVGCLSDVVTTIRMDSPSVEEAIWKYADDCTEYEVERAGLALRVACNSCLALSHYGNRLDYLFPKDVESDKQLGKENSPRGERARRRLALAVRVASFDTEVTLRGPDKKREKGDSQPTGDSRGPQWIRGHWKMQACGEKWSQRKRIFVKPYMIRSDLFVGELSRTSATYKTK